MAKSTKAEVAQRVQEVLEIRLAGAMFHDIRSYAVEKGWKVGDNQLLKYIVAANKLLAEDLKGGRKQILSRHLAQRRTLYARAFADGDWRTALAVLRDEAEMYALYPEPESELLAEVEGLRKRVDAFVRAKKGRSAAGE